MKTKPTIAIALLATIITLAAFLLANQRQELKSLQAQIVQAETQSGGANEEISRRPDASAAGTRASDKAEAGLAATPVALSTDEREDFIRHMRKLIKTHDSGMSTFIPDERYTKTLARMSVDDLKATLADVEASEINFSDKHYLKRNMLNRLAKVDPAHVLEIAHDGGSQSWRESITASVSRLSQSDPRAAREWLDDAEWDGDPDYEKDLFEVHAAGLATSGDIRGALEALDEVGGRELAFKRIALAAKTQNQRALVIQHIEPEQRAGAKAAFARAAHYRGGFAAGKAVFNEQFPSADDEGRSAAMLELATETFDDGDVPATADWVLSRSGDGDRIKTIEGFVGEWVDKDYNGAAQWIGEMDTGVERNAAIVVLVDKVRDFDPKGAAVWAKEISQ